MGFTGAQKCYIRIRIWVKAGPAGLKSAISEKEIAIFELSKVLFPDKHSRELPGSLPEFSNKAFSWSCAFERSVLWPIGSEVKVFWTIRAFICERV